MKKIFFTFTVMLMALMSVTSARAKEAYAVYSPSRILTFYYDDEQSSRSMYGTVYSVGFGSWTINNSNLDGVIFDSSFAYYKPTSTANWFANSPSLLSVEGLEYLNTSEVTDMSYMFSGCSSLTSLDLRGFDTGKVTNMNSMFYGCSSLVTIKVGDGWTTAKVTNSDYMFYDCTSLRGCNGTSYNASHIDKAYARVDGNGGQGYLTGNVPYVVFNSNSRILTFYYDDKQSTRTMDGNVYSLGFGSWMIHNSYLDCVIFDSSFADYKPTSTANWFMNCSNLSSIDGIQYLNTSEVTDMSSMFSGCSSLTSLDLRGFDTGKVTNMNSMFYGCSSLVTIQVGDGWTTAKVTNSDYMFYDCTSLRGCYGTVYNESHIDKAYARVDGNGGQGYLTGNIPYVVFNSNSRILTFYYDDKQSTRTMDGTIYSLGFGSWMINNSYLDCVIFNSSFADYKPTSTANWFANSLSLSSVEGLEYLNTSEVTDMSSMFSGCMYLTSLDLSSFDTGKVTDMSSMFYGCYELTTITVGDGWTTSNVTASSGMFDGCSNLKGGNGTVYNASYIDKTYARIDGKEGPGYFTASPESSIATGIESVTNGKQSTVSHAPMFNLQGQRVNDSYKGVVIQNGRKMLKK